MKVDDLNHINTLRYEETLNKDLLDVVLTACELMKYKEEDQKIVFYGCVIKFVKTEYGLKPLIVNLGDDEICFY